MRRKDREITDRAEMEAILNDAPACRIGLTSGKEPYVIPVCFGYENGSIYIHSARKGRRSGFSRRTHAVAWKSISSRARSQTKIPVSGRCGTGV